MYGLLHEDEELKLMINGEKFTLTLKNATGQFQKFAIFQTFQEIADTAVKPLILAWLVGAVAPGSGEQSSSSLFAWRTNYSVTISNIYHEGDGILSTNSVQTPINLSGQNGFAVSYLGDFPIGAPAFVGSTLDGEKGMLLIQSDWKIPSSERQHAENCFLKVGVSMAGRQVAVADLHPDILYKFSLSPVYHIISGDFYPGQVITEEQLKRTGRIQFGDMPYKTLVLEGNGEFVEEKTS
jgi:hypothetical protein